MLVNSPLEIRRAIYVHLIDTLGVHVLRNEDGSLRLTACVGPDRNAEHIGLERRTTDNPPYCQVWGRRLSSTWGPHWECEELAFKKLRQSNGNEDFRISVPTGGAILRTCKRIYFEVMGLMMELRTFNVTDMQTLDAILDESVAYPSRLPSISLGFKESFLPFITTLNITLRLPLDFFRAFDKTKESEDRISTTVLEEDLKVWTRLPSRLANLTALHSLCIWLDHTHDRYWSVVNERAFISHFESLACNPLIDLSFDLPKLHPLLETPQRHYMRNEKAIDRSCASFSPLKICRVLRQRYQSETNSIGHYRNNYVQDFPHCFGHPIAAKMSLACMESWESCLWREGKPVEQYLSMVMVD